MSWDIIGRYLTLFRYLINNRCKCRINAIAASTIAVEIGNFHRSLDDALITPFLKYGGRKFIEKIMYLLVPPFVKLMRKFNQLKNVQISSRSYCLP